jgi:hypothetical protein
MPLLALLACMEERPGADAATPDAEPGVSFGREVFPVVKRSCALTGCHDQATTTNHVTNFSTAVLTYSRWVNGPGTDFCVAGPTFRSRIIVVPGRPADSYLIEKITSSREDLCKDAHHPRMPPPPWPPLPAEDIALFTRWVEEGARQN